MRERRGKTVSQQRHLSNFVYAALASFAIDIGFAVSPRREEDWLHVLRFGLLQEHNVGVSMAANETEPLAIERPMKVGDVFRLEVGDRHSR